MKKILMMALALVFVWSPLQAIEKPLSKKSLYQLKVNLTDQNGQASGLDTFRGSPVLVSMFYASCPYACPMLVKALQKVEQNIGVDKKKDLRVILVSFDPKRDTVEVLKEATTRLHVDEKRWKLARASEGESRQLANLLHIKYKQTSDSDYDHSSIITLLNAEGEVVFSHEGLDTASVAEVTSKVSSFK